MPNERADKIAMHFLEQEIQVKARELADYYDKPKVKIHVHINKETKHSTISIELI